MKLSVVIPTFNPQNFEPLLSALSEQTDKDFELVVVENGTEHKSIDLLLEKHKLHTPLVYIHEKSPGLNRARNLGVRASSGSHIALIDDDCVPHPDWIGTIKQSHVLYPNAGAIGGRVLLKYQRSRPFWLNPEMQGGLAELDYGDGVKALDRWQYIVGANLSFSRSTFDDVGGFNEKLGLMGDDAIKRIHDETEFISKASLIGIPGAVYAGNAIVEHTIPPQRTKFEYMIKRWFGQGVSDIEYDLLQGGADKAVRSIYTKVFQSQWQLENLREYAADFSGDDYEEFMWRGVLIRAAFLYGLRERLITNSPVYGSVNIIESFEYNAFIRGRRLMKLLEADVGYTSKNRMLQRALYNPQRTISPFTRVVMIAGMVSQELGLKMNKIPAEQTAA